MKWFYALLTFFLLLLGIMPIMTLIFLEYGVLPFEYHKTVLVNTPTKEVIKEVPTIVVVQNITERVIEKPTNLQVLDSNTECIRVYKPSEKNSNTYELLCSKR